MRDNELITTITWRKDHVIGALHRAGIEPTDEAVNMVIKELEGDLLFLLTQYGWKIIKKAIEIALIDTTDNKNLVQHFTNEHDAIEPY